MPNSSIARSYLALYNAAQAIGWAVALYHCVSTVWSPDGYARAYEHSNAVVSRYVIAKIPYSACSIFVLPEITVFRMLSAVVCSRDPACSSR